jgi:hypothetical protein
MFVSHLAFDADQRSTGKLDVDRPWRVFSADRLAHMFVHGLVRNCDRQQLQIALRRFAGTVPRRPAWYSLRQ